MKIQFLSLLTVTATLSVSILATSASAAVVQWNSGPGHNNHYYEYVPGNFLFDEAESAANSSALSNVTDSVGSLATITSSEEQAFLNTLFTSAQQYWIGASDAAVEGSWQWVSSTSPESGEPLSYFNWFRDEPNNQGNEDYIVANWAEIGRWNDVGLGRRAGYVVEYSSSVQAVPTPALLPGLMGFGVSILRKKKIEAEAA